MTKNRPAPTEAADPYLPDAGEAALLLRGAPWARFAAVGDSGAAGVTQALDGYVTRSWFSRVAQWLRAGQPGLAVLNLGTPEALACEVRQGQLAQALEFAPDVVAVLSGGNDLLRPRFDADATGADIAAVVAALAGAGATVIMTGLFDITASPYVADRYREVMRDRIAALSGTIEGIACDLGALYVDLPRHPAGAEPIYSSDGLHLNARGQAILATEVARCLGRHLARKPADQARS